MAGLKEKVTEFLKEKLTLTPKERAAAMMQPGGIGSAGAAIPEVKKGEIVGFTEPGKCCCGRVHPIKQGADGKEHIETGWY